MKIDPSIAALRQDNNRLRAENERLRAGLLGHACRCVHMHLDPAVHRPDCAYRKWASPEQQPEKP